MNHVGKAGLVFFNERRVNVAITAISDTCFDMFVATKKIVEFCLERSLYEVDGPWSLGLRPGWAE